MSKDIERLRELSEKATQGELHSMRDGNQFIDVTGVPSAAKCVGASRIPELVRPWNPHRLVAFGFKPEEYETTRFTDADADFIVACVNYVRSQLAIPDAKTTPGGNKTLPRCEVPDCVNQASFIINERALCKNHVGANNSYAFPPSLRKRS